MAAFRRAGRQLDAGWRMTAWLLTLNAGSSSLKFALFHAAADGPEERARGQVEGLGVAPHLVLRSAEGALLEDDRALGEQAGCHQAALRHVLRVLGRHFPGAEIAAVGHRVVHGGPKYAAPVILSEAIIRELEALKALAPLHQPHNLAGIAAAHAAFPRALQIACFDTAFHRSHPWVSDTFALPRRYYDRGVRRYGFHGLSYEYVTRELSRIAPGVASGRVVVAHLGNGASMCAVLDGRSVGSTMGFSALDGLPMGTRCGQLDPGVVLFLMGEEGLTAPQISDLLYKESGLKGLSGLSSDMRELEAAGTPEAAEAIDYFVSRIRRELGAMAAILNGLDAIVFCGGIGEHSPHIRRKVCENLGWLGIELDEERNRAGSPLISAGHSQVKALVIQTNEELMIARHSWAILR
jgi:acetate kinase